MTFKRYVIVLPNGTLYRAYNGSELFFKNRSKAEKIAVSWGKVKEVEIREVQTDRLEVDGSRA